MGAWGAGIFDNDAASDFLWEYEDAGVGAIEQAFDMVREGQSAGYIDVDAGSWGLAGAEIVSASYGKPSVSLDAETLDTMKVHEIDVRTMSGGVNRAIDTVLIVASGEDKSELHQLWGEGELMDEWLAGVDDLKKRLGSIAS